MITLNEAEKVIKKYPDRTPVLVYPINEKIQQLDKNKYLIPKDLIIASLIAVIRSRLRLYKTDALFFFIKVGSNYIVPESGLLIDYIYRIYKNAEGFLRIYYGLENTYG